MAFNIVGKKVKRARVQEGMQQVDLAAALSLECGTEVSQSSVSDIESGKRAVKDYELKALAKILGVDTKWLLDCALEETAPTREH